MFFAPLLFAADEIESNARHQVYTYTSARRLLIVYHLSFIALPWENCAVDLKKQTDFLASNSWPPTDVNFTMIANFFMLQLSATLNCKKNVELPITTVIIISQFFSRRQLSARRTRLHIKLSNER